MASFAVSMLVGCSSPEERVQSYYERGLQLLADGEQAKAGVEFRNALKLNNEFAPALFSLGEVEQQQGQLETAAKLFYQVTQLDPEHVKARLALANILILAGNLDEALKFADEAYALAPSDPKVLAVKAVLALKLNNSDKAIGYADEVLKADPKNVNALMVRAAERLKASDPKGALAFLEQATDKDKSSVELQLFRMKVLDALGDKKGIEDVFWSLIKGHPDQPGFRNGLTSWYLAHGKVDEAEKALRQFASEHPEDTQAALQLVAFLKEHRDTKAAKDELSSLIEKKKGVFVYRLALAELVFQDGDRSDAVAQMQALIDDTTDSADQAKARVQLARMLAAEKKMAEAEELVSAVLEDDAKNVDALTVRASIRLAGGRTGEAMDDLRAAANEAPQSSTILMLLADAEERDGKVSLAKEDYGKALRIDGFNPRVGMPFVKFLLRYGDTEQAERVLTEMRSVAPNDRQLLTELAQLKLRKQDWAGAEEIAEALRKLDSGGEDSTADQILATVLSGQQRYDEALSLLKSSTSRANDTGSSLSNLVRVYVRAGKQDQAEEFLRSALKDNPKNVEALVLLASLQSMAQHPDEAEATLKTAIEADTGGVVAASALGRFYASANRFDEAEAVLRKALEHQADNGSLQMLLAITLERSGQYDAAIDEYAKLLQKNPHSAVAANNLASLLSEHRSDQASLNRAFDIASRFQQTDIPYYNDTLGWIYYLKGEYAKAVTLIKAAAEKLPNSASVQYHLGMTYKALGEKDLAVNSLNSAIALMGQGSADGEKARSALDELQSAKGEDDKADL